MRAGLIGGLLVMFVAGCSAAAAPVEPALVRVIMADDWASAPAVREVFDQFERDHDHVRVQVQAVAFSQVPELVASAQELEQPYDLAQWHAFAAAATGLAQPLGEYWDAAGLSAEEFLPGALEDVTWLGEPFGLPLDTNALVLLADTTVLDEAGVAREDLATREGFLASAEAITATGAANWMVPLSTSSWQTYGWIRGLGGELVRVDPVTAEPTFTFDEPVTVAALEYLVELVAQELAPPPYGPDPGSDAVQAFAAGRTAVYATGSWDVNVVARTTAREVALDILPLPQAAPDEPVTVLGGSSLFVPEGAEQRDLAFELALRLTDDDVALRLADEEGRLPARTRVFDAPLFTDDPLLSAFVAQLPNARVMPLIAYPEVAQAFTDALNAALSGREAPAEAMANLQAFAEMWLASEAPSG